MAINIDGTPDDNSLDPQVAISESNIVIVYTDKDGNTDEFDVFTWVMDITSGTVREHNLSNNNSLCKEPKMVVTGDNVIVVWQYSGSGGIDLFVRTGVDNGINFLDADNISNTGGVQSSVQNDISKGQAIVAVGNNVFITWEDSVIEIGYPIGNYETAFNKSADGGLTFLLNQPLNLSEDLPRNRKLSTSIYRCSIEKVDYKNQFFVLFFFRVLFFKISRLFFSFKILSVSLFFFLNLDVTLHFPILLYISNMFTMDN